VQDIEDAYIRHGSSLKAIAVYAPAQSRTSPLSTNRKRRPAMAPRTAKRVVLERSARAASARGARLVEALRARKSRPGGSESHELQGPDERPVTTVFDRRTRRDPTVRHDDGTTRRARLFVRRPRAARSFASWTRSHGDLVALPLRNGDPLPVLIREVQGTRFVVRAVGLHPATRRSDVARRSWTTVRWLRIRFRRHAPRFYERHTAAKARSSTAEDPAVSTDSSRWPDTRPRRSRSRL